MDSSSVNKSRRFMSNRGMGLLACCDCCCCCGLLWLTTGIAGFALGCLGLGSLDAAFAECCCTFCACAMYLRACDPNPVVCSTIAMVALLIRSKASRHASAGGHFSIMSPSTDVAAKIVKSTSSSVSLDRTTVECQMAYRKDIPDMNRWWVARNVWLTNLTRCSCR